MPKAKGPPALGKKLKKELRENAKRLNKELNKTYKDLKSIGWGTVSGGRRIVSKKAKALQKSALALLG